MPQLRVTLNEILPIKEAVRALPTLLNRVLIRPAKLLVPSAAANAMPTRKQGWSRGTSRRE